jgi:sugar phosphate isomerase/epimerase
MTQLKLGVIVHLEGGPRDALKKVHDLDLPTCQVSCWDFDSISLEAALALKAASREFGVEVTTIWTGLPGKAIWNFIEGPATIGLVPPDTREARVRALRKGSDFARSVGVESITTHVGFIPEWPGDGVYRGLITALKEVASYCKANGQSFWFETGQETPITLLRTIEDVGVDNLGINLDPANLLMYGKANPVDALDVFGRYVRGVHAKDGEYPTNGRELGLERPLGEGRVNFAALVPKLKSMGFTGALTIEREISGSQQIDDIMRAKRILEPLC